MKSTPGGSQFFLYLKHTICKLWLLVKGLINLVCERAEDRILSTLERIVICLKFKWFLRGFWANKFHKDFFCQIKKKLSLTLKVTRFVLIKELNSNYNIFLVSLLSLGLNIWLMFWAKLVLEVRFKINFCLCNTGLEIVGFNTPYPTPTTKTAPKMLGNKYC